MRMCSLYTRLLVLAAATLAAACGKEPEPGPDCRDEAKENKNYQEGITLHAFASDSWTGAAA